MKHSHEKGTVVQQQDLMKLSNISTAVMGTMIKSGFMPVEVKVAEYGVTFIADKAEFFLGMQPITTSLDIGEVARQVIEALKGQL